MCERPHGSAYVITGRKPIHTLPDMFIINETEVRGLLSISIMFPLSLHNHPSHSFITVMFVVVLIWFSFFFFFFISVWRFCPPSPIIGADGEVSSVSASDAVLSSHHVSICLRPKQRQPASLLCFVSLSLPLSVCLSLPLIVSPRRTISPAKKREKG